MSTSEELLSDFQNNWARAVESRDLESLMSLYLGEAVLKPTLSNYIRRNSEDIAEYFKGGDKFQDHGFLNNGIVKVEFVESQAKVVGDLVVDMGLYRFQKENGEIVEAHFNFVLKEKENALKILAQHSSLKV